MYEFVYDVGDKVLFRLEGTKKTGYGYGTGEIVKVSLVDNDSGEVIDTTDEERIALGPMFEHYVVQPYFVGPGISYHAYEDGTFGVRGVEVLSILWDENVSLDDGDGFYVCVMDRHGGGGEVVRIAARLKPSHRDAALWLGIGEAQNPSVPFKNYDEAMNMLFVQGDDREWVV